MKRYFVFLLLSFFGIGTAYADQTIDQLSPAGVLGGTEKIPIFQSANPAVTTTPSAISSYILGSPKSGLVSWLNVKAAPFNAICDGGSHPLSGIYGSLGAAQAVYPFVTSLTQEIDYAALKLASNTALGADGSEHGTANPQLNIGIYIPHGICFIGNNTWHIAKADGIRITGDATTATQIKGNWIVLQFDGLWYSEIDNLTVSSTQAAAASTVTMSIASPAVVSNWSGPQLESGSNITFSTTGALPTGVTASTTYYVLPTGLTATSFQFAATVGGSAINTSGTQSGTHTVTAPLPAVLDVDGNALGTGTTFGVQADNFYGLLVGGGPSPGATNVVAVCRRGSNQGQCSEMTWTNFHINSCNFACYYQVGFNAINNVLIGGDMQSYQANGIYLVAGSVKVFGTSFESTTGYTQIANSGCDINASSSGANDTITVYGSRTESMCFYYGAWPQIADIGNVTQQAAGVGAWAANTGYASLNTMINVQSSSYTGYVYYVTTAGTSGSSAPTWGGGTVSDGTVVWTMLQSPLDPGKPFFAVKIAEGRVDTESSAFLPAARIVEGDYINAESCGSTPEEIYGSTRFRGTVTEGAGATGCNIKIRFQHSTQVQPTCTVSSPSGSTLTSYSVDLDSTGNWNLNLVNSTPGTFSWICRQ